MSVCHHPQHQQSLERTIAHVQTLPGALAVIVHGSVAAGQARPDSDLDIIVVGDDAVVDELRLRQQGTFFSRDLCVPPCPYVDGRWLSLGHLRDAALRGSEPTRYAFTGAWAAWSMLHELPELIARIPIYPEAEREHRMASFWSQMILHQGFFWGEAQRRDDPYLRMRSATETVLFGGRLLLAHNRRLFPCQKRLLEAVEACPDRPADWPRLARTLLTTPNNDTMKACVAAITGHRDWGFQVNPVMRFIEDVELAWRTGRHAVGEW
jgi:hypothetical protein